MIDSDIYALCLAARFSYTNTSCHREPGLDLLDPAWPHRGKYGFFICSEVLEHIPAAGIGQVRFECEGSEESGVAYGGPCSLPIPAQPQIQLARKCREASRNRAGPS